MSETTQTAAEVKVEKENPPPAATNPQSYNVEAKNRFEYEVRHNGQTYDTAHIYNPIGDDRYLQWLREFKIKGDEEDVSEDAREASCRLWDDVIAEVENIEYPEGADWKSLIDSQQKIDSLNDFLAVAIAEDDEKTKGKIPLGVDTATQIVVTEAFLNGDIVKQKHVLREKSFEFEKKYARIQGKRFKQEATKGLRRKAKIEYIPQDEKLGELYDEMFISVEGITGATPLRFKTTVIHHIFAPTLDAKKLGK